jgi:hypothetical protein
MASTCCCDLELQEESSPSLNLEDPQGTYDSLRVIGSPHVETEAQLPPPSKFRRNSGICEQRLDPAQIRRTILYIAESRRQAAEQESTSYRADIPELNIDEWRPVFKTSLSFRDI